MLTLYQDFVDDVFAVLSPTTTPNEPKCPICDHHYGQAGPGMGTHLDFFNELPGASRKTFIQHVVEPVITPCGHTFCTFCICVWLHQNKDKSYPMCQSIIDLPQQLRHWDDDSDINRAAINGLSISLHISTPVAEEIFKILKLSMRQLITTQAPMPFIWKAATMISDLPRLMVTIARRFHFQEKGDKIPVDLSVLRLHNPMQRITSLVRADRNVLKFFSRSDAPLAKHPDARKMYALLCKRIPDLEDTWDDHVWRCSNWFGSAKMLYLMVKEEMPDADGGVGKRNGGLTSSAWLRRWLFGRRTVSVWESYQQGR